MIECRFFEDLMVLKHRRCATTFCSLYHVLGFMLVDIGPCFSDWDAMARP